MLLLSLNQRDNPSDHNAGHRPCDQIDRVHDRLFFLGRSLLFLLHQTAQTLASDLEFLAELRPEMVGIGPFLPHKDTPFRDFPAGSETQTLYLLSLVRLLLPNALLPATTALGSVDGRGRQLGVLSGCNVVMPNLSPMAVREKYLLYNNKAGVGDDGESSLNKLRAQMQEIGYSVAVGRGDYEDGRHHT